MYVFATVTKSIDQNKPLHISFHLKIQKIAIRCNKRHFMWTNKDISFNKTKKKKCKKLIYARASLLTVATLLQ